AVPAVTPVTENVLVVLPAATVTLFPESCATALLFVERFTTRPLDGAEPLIVTCPFEIPPSNTEGGLRVRTVKTGGGCTVSTRATLCPPNEAPMIVEPCD